MPVTIMARLVQDGVAETNALIDQWMEANPGKEFPLDAGDLLVLELIKPVIESSLDKIGIDFIAGKGVMPKLSVWITNRVITKKPKSVSLREFVNQQIKALRDGGLIKRWR